MPTKTKVENFLKNPVVDKVLGFLSVLVSIYIIYLFIVSALQGNWDIYRAAIALNMLVIVITTMIRRTAKRVSTNPWFWFVTFMRSYWSYIVLTYVFAYNANNIVPFEVTNALLLIGIGIIIYSRLSLGRNIGFIPARRELITTGAYGWVRHPIHTGELFFLSSYILSSFSPLNFFLLMIAVVFIIGKSLIEEHFLKDDADYREYCKKVPYRWIPGVI